MFQLRLFQRKFSEKLILRSGKLSLETICLFADLRRHGLDHLTILTQYHQTLTEKKWEE